MTSKNDALIEIADITKRYELTIKEISDFLKNTDTNTKQNNSSIMTRLLGYMGGIFILAGLGTFISMFWGDMGSAARVTITLGTGYMAYIMALITLRDEKYSKASTPLFSIAAFLQPTGIFTTLAEYSNGGEPLHGVLFMAGVMLVQQGLTFIATKHTVLAFTSIGFACIFMGVGFDLLGLPDELITFIVSIFLLLICSVLDKTHHKPITGIWYFFGSVGLLWAVFDFVEGSIFEILYLGLCAGLIFYSTQIRSRVVLFTSTLSMLLYIGYFTAQHFANSIGWPISLVLLGAVFIGLSNMALKISQKYIK